MRPDPKPLPIPIAPGARARPVDPPAITPDLVDRYLRRGRRLHAEQVWRVGRALAALVGGLPGAAARLVLRPRPAGAPGAKLGALWQAWSR